MIFLELFSIIDLVIVYSSKGTDIYIFVLPRMELTKWIILIYTQYAAQCQHNTFMCCTIAHNPNIVFCIPVQYIYISLKMCTFVGLQVRELYSQYS